MLTPISPDELDYTWSDADPFNWNLEVSDDGVSGWTFVENTSGGDRSFTLVDSGHFYRVYGVDSGGIQITPYSNVVFLSP